MHDRRIDGKIHVFGNHGALWQNAMTWFDHETESIWSQPWGRAIAGELKGTQLQLIPFSLVPWETWKTEHPDTLALVSVDRIYGREIVSDNFVLGVAIGDQARAYPYPIAQTNIIINDTLGDLPLVVHVNPETHSSHIFIRQLSDGRELSFTGDAEQMIDDQTGSIWNPRLGLATEGELAGEALREIPYISSFPYDWQAFYPYTDFFEGATG